MTCVLRFEERPIQRARFEGLEAKPVKHMRTRKPATRHVRVKGGVAGVGGMSVLDALQLDMPDSLPCWN